MADELTIQLNIPADYDADEPLVTVQYTYSPGRPSPHYIHPSDDDGEAPECDIQKIDGKSWRCWSDGLLGELTERIMSQHEEWARARN